MLDYPLEVTRTGYHFWVGALSLLLYDYLLTLDDEVELFWKRRWTIATYLYLWTRYGGMVLMIASLSLITHVSDPKTACEIWFTARVFLGTINAWVIELSLFLRLYALYSCSRRIAYIVGSVFFAQMIFLIGICAFMMQFAIRSLDPDTVHGFIYCATDDPRASSLGWLYWGCLAILEAFIFLLTIWRAYELYRNQRNSTVCLSNLVSTLLWDSISYTLLVGIMYTSIIAIRLGINSRILSGLGLTLPIIMGGRMMVNVRKAVSGGNPSTPSQVSVHIADTDDNESPMPQWTLTYI